MKILITGGAGFIGSALIRHLITQTRHSVLNLDKLTYAGDLESISEISQSERYRFVRGDICDGELVEGLLSDFRPNAVIHLAAESHVDRSIASATEFLTTNVIGTYTLLDRAQKYVRQSGSLGSEGFRFLHVSTDEVYGDLEVDDPAFTETSPYCPSSPYSASKASSDHFVRAWYRTYGFPTLIVNCSNNYGPFQFPEKLIPQTILNAATGKEIPVYGSGSQIRDWLFVADHARALVDILERGRVGDTYNVGGNSEQANLDVVERICDLVYDLSDSNLGNHPREQIAFVTDRPGHDFRYAIDTSKIQNELGWRPSVSFDEGLERTVVWFLDNVDWVKGRLSRCELQ